MLYQAFKILLAQHTMDNFRYLELSMSTRNIYFIIQNICLISNVLHRKVSLYSWWQSHGSPLFDRRNKDKMINNNFKKGKRVAPIWFCDIYCKFNYRGSLIGFRSIWAELLSSQRFFDWVRTMKMRYAKLRKSLEKSDDYFLIFVYLWLHFPSMFHEFMSGTELEGCSMYRTAFDVYLLETRRF